MMKDITTALLASLFVLLSLVSLISADPIGGGASLSGPANVAELELRYASRK